MVAEQCGRMENIINLCMDSYSMEKQCGRIYHRYTKEPVHFSSLIEALKKMNDLYDEIGFPEAPTGFRSFLPDGRKTEGSSDRSRDKKAPPDTERKEVEEKASLDYVMGHKGDDATFIIRVQYRQHASWQGEVTWVDSQKKEHFRSALELVELLDSILGTERR